MTPAGLSSEEARQRLQRHGENTLPRAKPESLARKLLRQFNNPLIFILLFALVIDIGIWFYHGADAIPIEALAIALIVLANAAMGLWQDLKSEAALSRLQRLTTPHSRVYRDGRLRRLESRELVPGDWVRVESGERIPADGVVTEAAQFLVDESILTGESAPVDVAVGRQVFSGSLAVRGNATFEVQATGRESSMGKLASMLGELDRGITPLEKRLKVMGRKIAIVVVTVAVGLLAAGLSATGAEYFTDLFLFAVALAVAAVPESLPAVITFALALGVERMARRKAIVRKLSAVETLGSVTVIATDKTGTLTENKMAVCGVDCVDEREAHKAMVLVNDADLETGAGDPLELGILRYIAQLAPESISTLRRERPRLSSRPFDAEWKFMRVTVEDADRHPISYIKGAPEAVLGRCALDDQQRREWMARVEKRAAAGERLLALACGGGETETGLRWLGVIRLIDPPRSEVPGAIGKALAAGIRVIMITGDHPTTARAIGEQIGLPGDAVVAGDALASASPTAQAELARQTPIFARVLPEQKLAIVRALQQQGEVVAVTGDGVNDAPALKAADVGVAMGQRGSDVSREVADLVLMDDNFATIIDAVEEGRGIYENIQKFIRSLFAANFAEVLLIGVGALIAFQAVAPGASLWLPITAAQILWINLLTDCVPALAIAADRSPGALSLKPRAVTAPLLDGNSLAFIVFTGLVGGGFALGMLLLLPWFGFSPGVTQTMTFCYLTLAQFTFVNPARRAHQIPAPNFWAMGAIFSMLALQLLAMCVPALRRLLGLTELEPRLWLALAMAVAVSWVLAAVCSRYLRARFGATAS